MAADTPAARRPRKRRRRAASYSTSSSEDSDSSASEDEKEDEKMELDASSTSSSSSSSSSSSDSSSDSSDSDSSDSSDSDSDDEVPKSKAKGKAQPKGFVERPRQPTLSPSPPPRDIPSFLAAEGGEDDRRARFRRVYMEKIVEGFGGDLESMRESDPTLGPSRLQLLINSLAAGVDVFAEPSGDKGVDEVGVILNEEA
ncbi:hypothetical protein CspeluHIS016_0110050 [Cutaneotrichosporon spelunceum]|uniref:Ribosome assembly protein 3 n=1 Tax=Cutaneotrichosporon spelunceum TaxID=1672016 RepID=A0AAD3TPP7_9TREE|nr:hypothetical protein CspeluHIS016_0110050 [Cutaneotrichosporon spelunceum]